MQLKGKCNSKVNPEAQIVCAFKACQLQVNLSKLTSLQMIGHQLPLFLAGEDQATKMCQNMPISITNPAASLFNIFWQLGKNTMLRRICSFCFDNKCNMHFVLH